MNEKKIRIAAALMTAALAGWSLLSAQGGGFRFNGALARFISPNGDGLNDYAIFCLDNPADSGVEAKIFTKNGALVSSMSSKRALASPPPGANPGPVICPAGVFPGSAQFVYWDGKAGGSAVRSGVYVYQIKAEGQAFTGTLVVVR